MRDHREVLVERRGDGALLDLGVEDDHQLVLTHADTHLLWSQRSRSLRDRRVVRRRAQARGDRHRRPGSDRPCYRLRRRRRRTRPATTGLGPPPVSRRGQPPPSPVARVGVGRRRPGRHDDRHGAAPVGPARRPGSGRSRRPAGTVRLGLLGDRRPRTRQPRRSASRRPRSCPTTSGTSTVARAQRDDDGHRAALLGLARRSGFCAITSALGDVRVVRLLHGDGEARRPRASTSRPPRSSRRRSARRSAAGVFGSPMSARAGNSTTSRPAIARVM